MTLHLPAPDMPIPEQPDGKRCRTCREWKPLEAFHKGSGKDGRENECGPCRNARKRENRLTREIETDRPGETRYCKRCQTSRPSSDFGINRRYKDGRDVMCLACGRERKRASDTTHREQKNRRERERRARTDPKVLREKRLRKYWSNPKRERERKREAYWEDPAKARERDRAKYWRDPDRERRNARKYRRAHPEKIAAQHRRSYLRHREKRLAYGRAKYWQNPEKARYEAVRYYWRLPEEERRKRRLRRAMMPSSGGNTRRPGNLPLEAGRPRPNGKYGPSLLDRVADRGAVDPLQRTLSRETQGRALAWMTAALSPDEQAVLTAYADNGFDADRAATLVGLSPTEVLTMLTRIRERASREIDAD